MGRRAMVESGARRIKVELRDQRAKVEPREALSGSEHLVGTTEEGAWGLN